MVAQVVIADASDLMLAGIAAALRPCPDCQVVGQARSIDDLWLTIAAKKPAIVILSERVYGVNTLSAVEQLRVQWPHLRVIVLSMRATGWLIHELLQAGVRAYLHKGDDLREHLETALHMVMLGRPYLSPTASTAYLLETQSPATLERLTVEARQVLYLLAHGADAGQIAYHLKIDKRRVYWLREKLRRRFGAQTNEHLIYLAIVEGVVYPGE